MEEGGEKKVGMLTGGGGGGAYCRAKAKHSTREYLRLLKNTAIYMLCSTHITELRITDKSPTLSTGSMVTSSCATTIFTFAYPIEFNNGVPIKAISGADGKPIQSIV